MTVSSPELYQRARAHLNAGRNAAARRDLARAAERTDDPDLLARIAGYQASLVIRQGEPAQAERIAKEALARTGLTPATAAVLHGQLGLIALERGALDEAVALLDKGIAGVGDDRDHRPAMLNNRSVAHMQAGNLREAVADLEAAAADYTAMGEEVQSAMALHNAGYVALLAGDLVGALEAMARARAVLERTSAVNVAICDLDRAEVLRDAGMATDAESSLGRVAQVFAAHRMRQARGEAEFHLSRSLLAHAPRDAAVAAAKAARTFRSVDSEWWALRAEAVRHRGRLLAAARGGDPRIGTALADVERVASALEERRLRADAASLRLTWELARARSASAEGAKASARDAESSRQSPVRTPRDAPIPVRLLAHEVRAARAAASRNDAAARRHAAAGLDELSRWQASFGSLDLATSLLNHAGGLIRTGLSAAARSARPDVVFEWSERARRLSQQSVPLRPPPDPELADDLAQLRMLRADIGSGDWLRDPRAQALSEKVRERQWTATGAAATGRTLGLDEFEAALDDGTAYLTYIFDDATMVALAVADGKRLLVPIEDWPEVARALAALRADLDMSATVRSGPLAASISGALEARLAWLSQRLVEPLLPVIADRRLVLTIPGILGGMPWGMLPALRGRTLTVATSAAEWAQRPPLVSPRTVGLAAGPRVARAEEEIARAGRAWKATETLAGDASGVAAVTDLATRSDLLHVAAHGRHSRDHPLFSGMELADGTLFGYDIDLIPEVPQVVVMSACEVGRSAVRGGEEAIGMTRIWLHAGTACVVAAPVVVADDVACELLGEMHQDLARGTVPAEALALATRRTGLSSPFLVHGSGF